MAAITTIISAIAAAASLASGVAGATGALGGKKSSPTITPPAVPAGPAADMDAKGILGQKPTTSLTAPVWAGLDAGMTNLQKRSKISTLGSQGSDGRYGDSAVKDYYKNLLLTDYTEGKGLEGGVLPTEYQYAENVLGVKPRERTAESLISAILRG